MKRNRFIKFTDAKKSVNRELGAKARTGMEGATSLTSPERLPHDKRLLGPAWAGGTGGGQPRDAAGRRRVLRGALPPHRGHQGHQGDRRGRAAGATRTRWPRCRPRGRTSNAGFWRRRCAGTPSTGYCSTGTAPSSSPEHDTGPLSGPTAHCPDLSGSADPLPHGRRGARLTPSGSRFLLVAIARSPLSRRGSRGPPTPNSCRLRPATHIWSPVS